MLRQQTHRLPMAAIAKCSPGAALREVTQLREIDRPEKSTGGGRGSGSELEKVCGAVRHGTEGRCALMMGSGRYCFPEYCQIRAASPIINFLAIYATKSVRVGC